MASGVAVAIKLASSSSTDPAYTEIDSAGATHHSRPSWMTSIPNATPNGNRPSPAGRERRSPRAIS